MTNAGAPTVVNGDVGSSTSIDAGVTHPGYGAYGAGTPELAGAQAALLTAYGFARRRHRPSRRSRAAIWAETRSCRASRTPPEAS